MSRRLSQPHPLDRRRLPCGRGKAGRLLRRSRGRARVDGRGGRPPAAACGSWARDLRRRPRPGVRARWHADRASVLLRGLGVCAPASPRVRGLARELAQESGRDLLRLCGGIYIGDPESPVFTGSLASARLHGLEHEALDAAEIAAHFPTMRPPGHALGLYEANAGYVRPEETVLANVDLARRDGADLRFSEPVTHWASTPGGGVEVVTSRGRYGADRLVLAPGAWVSTLLPQPVPIAVERQILYWLEPDFTPEVPYEAYAQATPSTWRKPTATGSSTASRWSTGPPAGSSSPTTGRTTG